MKLYSLIRNLICLAAGFAIVSCGGGADYRNILPADSYMTLSVNPASLTKKSGSCASARNLLLDRCRAALDKDGAWSPEERDYLLSLLENPEETGLELNKEFFIFVSAENADYANPRSSGGMLFPVGDKAKLDALVERINAKSGTATVVEDGLSIVKIGEQPGGSGVCAYNDMACLLYFTANPAGGAEAKVRELFAQKRSGSLMGNKTVAARLTEPNDINIVIPYVGKSVVQDYPMLSPLVAADVLQGAALCGSVNFEKGRIVSENALIFEDERRARKMREEYMDYGKPQTGELMRYVPANCVAVLSCGLDGGKWYAKLMATPGYGMLLDDPKVKRLFEAIDGDFVISFAGMSAEGRYPKASVLARVDDPTILQAILADMPDTPYEQTAEGAYSIVMGGSTMMFGVKDDVLYCTTDAAVKSAIDGAKIESLTSLDAMVKGKYGTLYLDFEGLNAFFARMYGPALTPPMEATLAVLGLFDNLESCAELDRFEAVLNMNDRERNALETLCVESGALIRRYMPEAVE